MSEIGATAARHGRELLEHGFTIDQVVHAYGDLCQAITESAIEHDVAIDVDEFRTLNRCLDNAIADAVTEFTYQRDLLLLSDPRIQTFNERLGCLGQELRNLIHTATLVFASIKAGNVGVAGATSTVLDRSLAAMRDLIDRSLADVRVTAGLAARHRLLSVADRRRRAQERRIPRGVRARMPTRNLLRRPDLAVEADHDMLLSAIAT